MDWSRQQDAALRAVASWLRNKKGPQVFRLFGYAGTGKTTLARHVAEGVKGPVLFGAFTGKAALVLRSKGCANASTIHSMIYSLDDENFGEPTWTLNPNSEVDGADLVIIDECSMVNEELGKDLLSFGTRVLVLGDPAQLPPVSGGGFFTDADPDFMLTEIHRQARDNPIIAMSQIVREGGSLDFGSFGESRVISTSDIDADQVLAADQVLVGRNNTRRAYNGRIRKLLGRKHPLIPERGDRLVCLKNKRPKGLLNGSLWEALRVDPVGRSLDRAQAFDVLVLPQDAGEEPRRVSVQIPKAFFSGTEHEIPYKVRKKTEEFDFGYALTVHKSQGSQWPNVMVFDESAVFQEAQARHLYTAITRAADRVTVVKMGRARC